ncbi:hypothetical protein Sjap_006898 [Stephania japonica]|uniref:PUM-HD domain-containing protein n=1 Tax=Stephania japonica TaxID=461633 RepID=A0AAP0PMD7_9MAGN
MAAKNQSNTNTASPKKRQRVAANAKSEAAKAISKNPKFSESKSAANPPNKLSKKPFKSSSSFEQSEKKVPKSKRELRLQAKELAEARKKKRKRHYSLEQELASLWEKMRRHNISKEERSKLVSEAMQKMKGTIPEIAGSHVSSRVLQTCVKYCSQAERDAVFEELRPHFLNLACNTYAVHLLKKMLDNASKKQLEAFMSILHGHVVFLLRNMVGSVVVEHAYQLGNAAQKQSLLLQLYSKELQLFKDLHSTKERRLVDLIPKLSLNKSSVQRELASVIQPILEKGIVDHSIIHRALLEYLSIADKTSATDVIEQLSGPLLVRMIGTRDGAKLGILCNKHGGAKGRKKIIKGIKGHVGKIAHDQYGSTVLVSILSMVDDTKLVSKVVIRELQPILKELVFDKSGRRPLLQLLHPNSPRYLGVDDMATLSLSIPSLSDKAMQFSFSYHLVNGESDEEEAIADNKNSSKSPEENLHSVDGGKKDPSLRRIELLVNSGLAQSLVDTCIENAGELLRSNFGKEVIYEVATGGVDGVLLPTLAEKINDLHGAIASLASLPKTDESDEEHVLENFHSSRTLRKLVLDCPTFALTLWKTALEGKAEIWAQGHSCKVISAFMESSDSKVLELTKKELQPLIERGILKLPENKLTSKEG